MARIATYGGIFNISFKSIRGKNCGWIRSVVFFPPCYLHYNIQLIKRLYRPLFSLMPLNLFIDIHVWTISTLCLNRNEYILASGARRISRARVRQDRGRVRVRAETWAYSEDADGILNRTWIFSQWFLSKNGGGAARTRLNPD